MRCGDLMVPMVVALYWLSCGVTPYMVLVKSGSNSGSSSGRVEPSSALKL